MNKLIFNEKIVICLFLCFFGYSQNINIHEYYNNNNDRELVFIKDVKLKKILEDIIINKNFCKNSNLAWCLQEKKNIYSLSLFIKGYLSNEDVKYITIINDFPLYIGKSNIELKKLNLMVKFKGNDEDIIFQDYSYWVIIKESDEYVIKKEVINCGQ